MAPSTTNSDDRALCAFLKRFAFGLVNVITLIITCIYISWSHTHSQAITAHPSTLKNPYGGPFDLSLERVGSGFAVGRAIFLFLTLVPFLAVPECLLFLFSVGNLVFEIPLALVAQSTFGYQVTFSGLDLTPATVDCSFSTSYDSTTNTTSVDSDLTQQQWDFFTAYGTAVGKPAASVCQEFVHEGSLLRGSLLFAWFTLWISFFLIAFVGACCRPERKWSDFLEQFTGFEFGKFSWATVRAWMKAKVLGPSMQRLRWRRAGSDRASTLVDEEVEVKFGEKGNDGVGSTV